MSKISVGFLKKLVETVSPSGYEEEAAAVWQAEARTFAREVRRDVHGNSVAIVGRRGPRVMLSGHYDEIGFLVSYIDPKGFLWIVPVGGWDPQIPQGHRVIIRTKKGRLRGVIGKCPIHLQPPASRDRVTPLTDLWVDIGAKTSAEAQALVSVGDPLVLDHGYMELQNNLVSGRALDDKGGAFVVLEVARRLSKMKSLPVEVHAVATVQEEIGLRGARTSAFGIDPLVGIAVDVTHATDYPTMGEHMKREGKVDMGKGPVLTRGANINGKLFDLMTDTARKHKIPFQIVAEPGGTGTDANAMQVTRAGVATALVSLPNRYMHSSCELVSLKDLEYAVELIAQTVLRIHARSDFRLF